MPQPIDAAQREQALDLSQSFIVQAPAGSGKTELLTQRFLKLLARVDRPERVLAITFTRKATREMHTRIVRRLQQAQVGSAQEDDHEQRAIELARAVLQRDREMGWSLLKNPGRLRVYTIDSLCVQLLARDPECGGHIAGRSVQEDAKPLYRRAVEQVFEDLGRAEGAPSAAARDALVRVLVHLDGNAATLQDLLVTMLGVRDQWTRKMGIDDASLTRVLHDRQEQELARFRQALASGNKADGGLDAAMRLVTLLGKTLDDPDCAAARFATAATGNAKSPKQAIQRAHLFSKLFMTAANSARKPGSINRSLFKGVSREAAELIPELKGIYSNWCESEAAIKALERMARMPPIDLGGDNPDLLADVREVLKYTLAHLQLVFAAQGAADFHFMAESALECLGDAENPGQVLLDEDLRLEHILMDEFQDTSNTQFDLLSRLIAGWDDSGSRTLFLVGDPMQSIYRFREANVGLFIDVAEQGRAGGIPLKYLRLESNFRSNSEIIDWVNQQFSQIFPTRNQRDSGAVSYAGARSEIGPGGAVQVHPLDPANPGQNEACLAIELIRAARSELDDPSIAVLARARKHLAPLAQALLKEGIPFEAVKVDPLAGRPVVQDLLAITRALIHPADRIAWLALLRAPWCGLSTPELHWVAGNNPRDDLFERIGLCVKTASGEIRRFEQLARLHRVLDSAIGLGGSRSVRERVEYTWLHLGGPYCYASSAELENATAFLNLLGTLEREGSEDLLGRLDEKLGDLHASSRPSKLQLMTIHQAKGLEFDVVILPGLHRTTGNKDKPLVALQEFRTSDGRDTALMAAPPYRGTEAPTVYEYLRAVDAERAAYETQRTLYVATTRARTRLHLLAECKVNDKTGEVSTRSDTFLAMLRSAFANRIEAQSARMEEARVTPETGSKVKKTTPAAPTPLPLLQLVDPPPLPEPMEIDAGVLPAVLHPLPSREAAALGDALHHWLELIHNHPGHEWTAEWFTQHSRALASTLRRTGVSEARVPALLPDLTRMLVQAVTSREEPGLIQAGEGVDSWAELTLFRKEGIGFSQHVIDRLYRETGGGLVVADYKSGEDSPAAREKWREQLERYRQLIEELGAGEVSRTLIYQTRDNTVVDLTAETSESG